MDIDSGLDIKRSPVKRPILGIWRNQNNRYIAKSNTSPEGYSDKFNRIIQKMQQFA